MIQILKIFLITSLIPLTTCEPEIANDQRITINGTVVDANGDPIPNISVRFEKHSQTLGSALSDANGVYKFTSLQFERLAGSNVLVNLKSDRTYYYDVVGSDYGSEVLENKNYSGVLYFTEFDIKNKESFNLGTARLGKIASLNLLINNLAGDTNKLAYTLEYNNTVCSINISGIIPEENCIISQNSYNQLDETSTNTELLIESQLNTEVLFKYILNDQPEQVITIPLSNLQNTYVFEY